jgi:peptidoglycan/xylan/chitin deacetylase (PgdA/CDA1 family)
VFFHHDLKGLGLPPKTLCLTYDDGPGQHTQELGCYLHQEGIPATFFVVGSHARGREHVLRRLCDCGHTIGNHTWTHPGLVSVALSGGDVVGELERTDALIRPYVRGEVTFLRPPYGNWRERDEADEADKPISIICNILNSSGRFGGYVGPVNWDIVAEDWECWQQGVTPQEAARRCLAEIQRKGRGIVLMHDCSEEPAQQRRNCTAAMTRLLVPLLKERGYRFVGLDEAPQVRAAIAAARGARLKDGAVAEGEAQPI